jgi:hypothetical protein
LTVQRRLSSRLNPLGHDGGRGATQPGESRPNNSTVAGSGHIDQVCRTDELQALLDAQPATRAQYNPQNRVHVSLQVQGRVTEGRCWTVMAKRRLC